jgi:hypothetical protein
MLKCERNVQYDYSERIFRCSYQGDGNEVPLPCPSFIFVGLAFSRWRSKLFAQKTEITQQPQNKVLWGTVASKKETKKK